MDIIFFPIDEDVCDSLLYRAPELLRAQNINEFSVTSLQKADVYSFAIILYELYGQKGPFGTVAMLPSQILKKLICQKNNNELIRPDLNVWNENWGDFIKVLLKDAWSENPYERPDFKVNEIKETLASNLELLNNIVNWQLEKCFK